MLGMTSKCEHLAFVRCTDVPLETSNQIQNFSVLPHLLKDMAT